MHLAMKSHQIGSGDESATQFRETTPAKPIFSKLPVPGFPGFSQREKILLTFPFMKPATLISIEKLDFNHIQICF